MVSIMVVRGQPVHADSLPLLRQGIDQLADAGDADAAPDELRSDLQSLMAHHSTLAVRFTRATVAGDAELVDVADEVLAGSSGDLQRVLQPAIGGEAAASFAKRWQLRSGMLFRYATGVRDSDQAVQQEARRQLQSYDEIVAALLADATDGRLDQRRLSRLLEDQTRKLLRQTEHYAAGEHGEAYRVQRKAFARTYPVAASVAAAATGRSTDVTPAEQLRTSMARLLGEHVELTVDAMRAGVTGAPEFDAAAAALDGNTADVVAAMHSLLPDTQADRAADVWADLIDRYMQYTVAVTERDEDGRAAARSALTDVVDRFGAVMAEASDGALHADEVGEAVRRVERRVLAQVEQYADGDHTQAHATASEAYLHMTDLAGLLAGGLADAVGDRLPQGGAATGAGGDLWEPAP
jgi:hypothetical protein